MLTLPPARREGSSTKIVASPKRRRPSGGGSGDPGTGTAHHLGAHARRSPSRGPARAGDRPPERRTGASRYPRAADSCPPLRAGRGLGRGARSSRSPVLRRTHPDARRRSCRLGRAARRTAPAGHYRQPRRADRGARSGIRISGGVARHRAPVVYHDAAPVVTSSPRICGLTRPAHECAGTPELASPLLCPAAAELRLDRIVVSPAAVIDPPPDREAATLAP
jgi:hypothetical protein